MTIVRKNTSNRLLIILGCICLGWWIGLALYWTGRGEVFHLLWLCDLTLLITGIGLLFRQPLLVSSQFIGTFLIQAAWNIDFWIRLVTGSKVFGLTEYMFSPDQNVTLKFFSLFHIFLPVVMIYGVRTLGYSQKGWLIQATITVIVYALSYATTYIPEDTNWVLGPLWRGQDFLNPLIYLVVWTALTIFMYWIFNLLLKTTITDRLFFQTTRNSYRKFD